MAIRKIIIVDEEMDKALGNICDAALKGSGLQVVSAVNSVIESVVEEPDSVVN